MKGSFYSADWITPPDCATFVTMLPINQGKGIPIDDRYLLSLCVNRFSKKLRPIKHPANNMKKLAFVFLNYTHFLRATFHAEYNCGNAQSKSQHNKLEMWIADVLPISSIIHRELSTRLVQFFQMFRRWPQRRPDPMLDASGGQTPNGRQQEPLRSANRSRNDRWKSNIISTELILDVRKLYLPKESASWICFPDTIP